MHQSSRTPLSFLLLQVAVSSGEEAAITVDDVRQQRVLSPGGALRAGFLQPDFTVDA